MPRPPFSDVQNTPMVTALPAGVADGTEVDLIVDDAGTYGGPLLWRCKYRAATAGLYKWHVISGGEVYIENSFEAALAQTTTYATVSGTPTTLVVPYAGAYDCMIEGWMASATSYQYLSYTVGTAAANDSWAAIATISGTSWGAFMRKRRQVITAANLSMVIQARTGAAQTSYYGRPRLSARPVRIG